MTTTLAQALPADTYQSFGVRRVIDPDSIENTLGRRSAVPSSSRHPHPGIRPDTASFSGTSSLVVAALNDSSLRTERLATLRHAIATGSYHVAAETVADSLLNDASIGDY